MSTDDAGAAYWDAKYRARAAPWSSETNERLMDAAAAHVPGDALDVGCGEGADAIALAARGWRVTAVDISLVALERGRAHDATGRIVWQQADLRTWQPTPAAYDLVAAHYLHFPSPARERMFAALARAVRADGALLFVAHAVTDLQTGVRRPHEPGIYAAAEELAALLEPHAWNVVVAEALPRDAHDGEGNVVTVHDVVIHALRR